MQAIVQERHGAPEDVLRRNLKLFTARVTAADLNELRSLIEAGQVTPVIDRIVPLTEGPAAIALVEQGRPAGEVVVTVDAGDDRPPR